MNQPPPGGPPKKVTAPLANGTATKTLTSTAESTEFAAALKRRRAASQRLPILDSGRADPWHHDSVPLTALQVDAWQRTVAHLTAAGFKAIIPAEVLGVLR